MRGIPESGPASAGFSSIVSNEPRGDGVVIPVNPLTQQWDAITGGRATVSLPPPVPMPSEVEPYMPEDFPLAVERPPVSNLTHSGPLTGFGGLDLRDSLGPPAVLGTNGETFPMTEKEIEEASQFCLKVAKRVMTDRLAELENRFAVKPKKRGPRKS